MYVLVFIPTKVSILKAVRWLPASGVDMAGEDFHSQKDDKVIF